MQPQSFTLASSVNPNTNKILHNNTSPMSSLSEPFSSSISFLTLKRKRKPQNSRDWTDDEEDQLLKYNEKYPHNWRQISRLLKTKTPIQCSYKFEKISSESKISKFTRNEDILLIELVNKNGKNWELISKAMHNKYSKETLKKRYFEKLLPGIAKEFSESKKIENKINLDCDLYNNKIIISLNNNYVFLPCEPSHSAQKGNSVNIISHSIVNSSFIPNEKPTISFMVNNATESLSQSFLSTEPNNERNKQLFIIEKKGKELSNNDKLMFKLNQILRKMYKRLIQIYQLMINLDYSDQSIIKAILIERKKELSTQVKNYKFKFNVSMVLSKMHELEETITFARKKINYYLDINK